MEENSLVLSREQIIKNYNKVYEVTATIEAEGENSEETKKFYFTKPTSQSFSRYIKRVNSDAYEASVALVKGKCKIRRCIEEY